MCSRFLCGIFLLIISQESVAKMILESLKITLSPDLYIILTNVLMYTLYFLFPFPFSQYSGNSSKKEHQKFCAITVTVDLSNVLFHFLKLFFNETGHQYAYSNKRYTLVHAFNWSFILANIHSRHCATKSYQRNSKFEFRKSNVY